MGDFRSSCISYNSYMSMEYKEYFILSNLCNVKQISGNAPHLPFWLVRLSIQWLLPLLFKFAERYILSYKVPANSKLATVLVANNRCKLGRGKLIEELVLIQRNRITRLRRLIYKCYCQTSTVDTNICNIVVGKIFKIALSREGELFTLFLKTEEFQNISRIKIYRTAIFKIQYLRSYKPQFFIKTNSSQWL